MAVPELVMSGGTDVGRMRDHNEDAIAWDARSGLALLADGMGGHNAGEVASNIAIEMLGRQLNEVGEDEIGREVAVHNAVADANSAIFDKSASQPLYQGMGTTLVLTLFRGNSLTVGHVGDSRIYRLRGGALERLTADHSLLQELVAGGFMTEEEAQASVSKNVITRALGIEHTVEVEVGHHAIAAGDVYLLCSDGLTDMADDNAIAHLLMEYGDNPQTAAAALVQLANRNGGKDNISVVVVRVVALTQD